MEVALLDAVDRHGCQHPKLLGHAIGNRTQVARAELQCEASAQAGARELHELGEVMRHAPAAQEYAIDEPCFFVAQMRSRSSAVTRSSIASSSARRFPSTAASASSCARMPASTSS